MKKTLSIGLALLVTGFSLSAQTNPPARSANSSIAVSIVYDGSGSMMDPVMGAGNVPTPKYFVAFDVSAKLFEPVKTAGALVVSASNEAELNAQINAILGKKILLEAE